MKNASKFLAFILAVVMLVGMLPATVLAASEPVSTRFEAEDAEVHNGTVNYPTPSNASGGVCVSYFRSGKVLIFAVTSDKAESNVPIKICGSSAKESGSSLVAISAEELAPMIKNNGVVIRDAAGGFPGSSTKNWYNFAAVTGYIDLAEGLNVITITNGGPNMNMDYIEIDTKTASLTWTPGKGATSCADKDLDHDCDLCGRAMGSHIAVYGTHKCDYCGKNVTGCVDADKDHVCDICDDNVGKHKPESGTHICGYCGEAVYSCDTFYDEGSVVKEATCTENGEIIYTCLICQSEHSEVIFKNGHRDENGDGKCDDCPVSICENHSPNAAVKENETAATCTTAGKYDSVVYCDVCGDVLSKETINVDALGHEYALSVSGSLVYNTITESYDASGLTVAIDCTKCDEHEVLDYYSVVFDGDIGEKLSVTAKKDGKTVTAVLPELNPENYTIENEIAGSDTVPKVTTTFTSTDGDFIVKTITSDYLNANDKNYSRYELSLLNSDSVNVTYGENGYIYNALTPVTLTTYLRSFGAFLTITGDVTLNLEDRWRHNNGIIIGTEDETANVVVNVPSNSAIYLWNGADVIVNKGSVLELNSGNDVALYAYAKGSHILVDGKLIADKNIKITAGVDWVHPDKDNYDMNPELYVRKGEVIIESGRLEANFVQVGSERLGYTGKLTINGAGNLIIQNSKKSYVRWVFSKGELDLNNTGNSAVVGMRCDANQNKAITFDAGVKVTATGNISNLIAHAWSTYASIGIHSGAKFVLPEATNLYNHENDYSQNYANMWNEAVVTIDGKQQNVWIANEALLRENVKFSYSQNDILSVVNSDKTRSAESVTAIADASYTTAEGTTRVGDWLFSKAVDADGNVIYYKTEIHRCESECEECGKCKDENCKDSACKDKCQCVIEVEDNKYGLNLMSFNIRTTASESNAINNWDNRKAAVVSFINNCGADVMGLQEVKQTQFDYISANLGGKYTVLHFPRQGGSNPEGLAIIYDAEKFNLVSDDRYWLSDTPDTMSKGWGESYYRVAFVLVLEHKETGEFVKVINTHGPLNDIACLNAYKLIMDRSVTGDCFTYLCGDFNATEGSAPYNAVAAELQDCRVTALESPNRGHLTYTGWGNIADGDSPNHIIDFCFVSDSRRVEVLTYKVRTDKWGDSNSNYLSDHYAVQTTVEIMTEYERGDVNNDGEVTNADIVVLARYLIDIVEFNAEQMLQADVNYDGEVRNSDLVVLVRNIVEA